MPGLSAAAGNPLRRVGEALCSLFFPRLCPVCGRALPEGMDLLCPDCLARLPRTGFLPQRGNAMEELFAGVLPLVPDVRLHSAAAFFYYKPGEPYTRLVTDLKYRHRRGLARALVEQMFRECDPRLFLPGGADVVMPVPIHWKKRGRRGYDQSAYIARAVGRRLGIGVRERGVRRVADTPSQTAFSHSRRFDNVAGAFRWEPALAESLRGRHLVLVDDVVTSGATVASCVEALCAALRQAPPAGEDRRPVGISILSLAFSKG